MVSGVEVGNFGKVGVGHLEMSWVGVGWGRSQTFYLPLYSTSSSYYMLEIILFFFFLIDSVEQIDRYYRKGICSIREKHTLWAKIQENILKTTFHVST